MANLPSTGASAPESSLLVRTVRVIRVEPQPPNPPFHSHRFTVYHTGGQLWTDEEFKPGDKIKFRETPDGKFYERITKEKNMLQDLSRIDLSLGAKTAPFHAPVPAKPEPFNAVRMTSLEIAELTGKRHDNVKQVIERLAERGTIGFPEIEENPTTDKGGRPGTYYVFDLAHKRDSFVVVAQLSPEFTAALVDRWQELEEDVKKNAIVLPGNYLAALKALTSEVEKREEAEARALEAERTKALIGSKREAQAMATASRELRRADALAAKLDESRKYASVKRMEKAYHRKFKWQPLKRLSEALGYHVKKAEDQNYGEVNTYHADIWLQAYALEIPA